MMHRRMQIRILDSWLREYLKTRADAAQIAKILSLTAVSVEKTEKIGSDYIYDIEITTNRVDLMSVLGIAKEASAVLPQHGVPADFIPLKIKNLMSSSSRFPIEIKSDPEIVNRICAVVMDVKAKPTPVKIKERLEASGIRSLNNLIDVTNYVMREIGHPVHVFDFDRLNTKTLLIRKSRKGESLKTLDGKTHTLSGGDIVAQNDKGEIVDLLGIMGTENSVVTQHTKRILYFIDNNNPVNIRNTSMSLAIRSEAAVLNEKGVDPNLAMDVLRRGMELYEDLADGKATSEILDIYPNIPESKEIKVSIQKINDVIGVEIPHKTASQILTSLGFETRLEKDYILVSIPSKRLIDVNTPEDVIEEIARVWGYEKLPSILPEFMDNKPYKFGSDFYFEKRVKTALKYLGFTESYTYSLVSENLFEGPLDLAVKIKNPLSEDMAYLRVSLIPSLLAVLKENKTHTNIKIFEIANVYKKRAKELPEEKLMFSAVIKKPKASFFEVKGIVEAVLNDIGIKDLKFKQREEGIGADVYKDKDFLGYIEVFSDNIIDFELDFEKILKFANNKKVFKPISKFPPIIEDISIKVKENVKTSDVVGTIKKQSPKIMEVGLMSEYEDKRTFHIIYQDPGKNLTREEVSQIRGRVVSALKQEFKAEVV